MYLNNNLVVKNLLKATTRKIIHGTSIEESVLLYQIVHRLIKIHKDRNIVIEGCCENDVISDLQMLKEDLESTCSKICTIVNKQKPFK